MNQLFNNEQDLQGTNSIFLFNFDTFNYIKVRQH